MVSLEDILHGPLLHGTRVLEGQVQKSEKGVLHSWHCASDVPEIRANRRAEQGEESVTVALATLLLTGLRTCQVPAELARPLLADLLECNFRMIYPPTGEE